MSEPTVPPIDDAKPTAVGRLFQEGRADAGVHSLPSWDGLGTTPPSQASAIEEQQKELNRQHSAVVAAPDPANKPTMTDLMVEPERIQDQLPEDVEDPAPVKQPIFDEQQLTDEYPDGAAQPTIDEYIDRFRHTPSTYRRVFSWHDEDSGFEAEIHYSSGQPYAVILTDLNRDEPGMVAMPMQFLHLLINFAQMNTEYPPAFSYPSAVQQRIPL